jgi:cellulose biosynthesis protein BcsQ
MPKSPPRPGRIITFYSYKGGTGRSMALANVAWLLAIGGARVLVIDWDLEAPGLHRYFRPFLDDPDLASSDGVIDYVVEFAEAASEVASETQDQPPEGWYKPYANLLRYAKPLAYDFLGEGTLDFIPAGRQDVGYAGRVNSFHWKNFYEKLGGWQVLDEARNRMREVYDYVLIDSRTGVSDTAGICTVQMPDALVVCFTLNLQSVKGASAAAMSVLEQRLRRQTPITVYPIPMRVEFSEKDKTDKMKDYAKPSMLDLLPGEMTAEQKEDYWGEMSVPYIPFYAFEENLAYFRDKPKEKRTVLDAMLRISRRITGSDHSVPDLDPNNQAQIIAAYESFSTTKEMAAAVEQTRTSVYLSCGDDDPTEIETWLKGHDLELIPSLRARSDEILFGYLQKTLKRAKAILLAVGPAGVSIQQRRELLYIESLRQAERGIDFSVVTVLLPNAQPETLPRFLLPYQVFDFRANSTSQSQLAVFLEDPHAGTGQRLPICPFPGPQPFGVDDIPVFFGREEVVNRIVGELQRSSAVALVGARGSGKTSCVYAGVSKQLLTRNLPTVSWEIRDFFAGSSSFTSVEENRQVLLVLDLKGEVQVPDLSRFFSGRSPAPVAGQTNLLERNSLLVVGTAEELATIERRVGLTIPRVEIPRMTSSDLGDYVRSVAGISGITVEPGFLQRLLLDLGNEEAALPLLQFALVRMWRSNPYALTELDYDKAGGRQVVERFCEGLLDELDDNSRALALRILSRVSSMSGLPAAINPIPKSGVTSEDMAVLQRFFEERVLEVTPLGGNAGTELVQFSHDIFINNWPRILDYAKQNREFLAWRDDFTKRSETWSRQFREQQLLSGELLTEAQARLIARREDFSAQEIIFIEESEKVELSRLATLRESAKQRREFERMILESQEAERKRRRRIYTALSISAIIIIIIATAAAILVRNRKILDGELLNARKFTRAGKFQQAIDSYNQVSDMHPRDASIVTELAMVYGASGDSSQALKACDRGDKLSKSNLFSNLFFNSNLSSFCSDLIAASSSTIQTTVVLYSGGLPNEQSDGLFSGLRRASFSVLRFQDPIVIVPIPNSILYSPNVPLASVKKVEEIGRSVGLVLAEAESTTIGSNRIQIGYSQSAESKRLPPSSIPNQ